MVDKTLSDTAMLKINSFGSALVSALEQDKPTRRLEVSEEKRTLINQTASRLERAVATEKK